MLYVRIVLFSLALGIMSATLQAKEILMTHSSLVAFAPMGFVVLCHKNPAWPMCRKAGSIEKSGVNEKLLAEVHSRVNAQMIVKEDVAFDTWQICPKSGDCEDFALCYADNLLSTGVSKKALFFAVVRTTRYTGHLVLGVRTSEGDKFLDNLSLKVIDLPELQREYTILKFGNANGWYTTH